MFNRMADKQGEKLSILQKYVIYTLSELFLVDRFQNKGEGT